MAGRQISAQILGAFFQNRGGARAPERATLSKSVSHHHHRRRRRRHHLHHLPDLAILCVKLPRALAVNHRHPEKLLESAILKHKESIVAQWLAVTSCHHGQSGIFTAREW